MKNKFTLAFIGLACFSYSQHIVKVKDINPSGNSQPEYLTHFDNNIIFSADHIGSGREPWISGGSDATTQLLKDINTSGDSEPYFFTQLGNKIYFSADDGVHGRELWVTDGTSAGTTLLLDINTSGNSNPNNFTEFNGNLIFAADDGVNGMEIWITDGTASGTSMLKDISPAGTGDPVGFQEFNGALYFRAADDTHGFEIWKTDGTSAGTQLFTEINPLGHGVIFPTFFPHNNELYFIGNNGNEMFELWKTDGTQLGTEMVKDINPSGNSMPLNFCSYGSNLLFAADDGVNGREIWISDGTSAGTQLLKDIAPGSASSSPYDMTVYNNKVYFKADDNDQGLTNKELWETDGTSTGTILSHDFTTAADGGNPRTFFIYGNRLFMVAEDDTWGAQLFIKDGSNAPQIVPPPLTMNYGGLSITDDFIGLNGELIFRADYDLTEGMELWKYTGLVSLEEKEKNTLKVYPNPFEDRVTIQDIEGPKELQIFNMLGARVYQDNINSNTVDLSFLKTGVYILKIKNEATEKTLKIVKN